MAGRRQALPLRRIHGHPHHPNRRAEGGGKPGIAHGIVRTSPLTKITVTTIYTTRRDATGREGQAIKGTYSPSVKTAGHKA
jgi:hypothetical protein